MRLSMYSPTPPLPGYVGVLVGASTAGTGPRGGEFDNIRRLSVYSVYGLINLSPQRTTIQGQWRTKLQSLCVSVRGVVQSLSLPRKVMKS